MSIKSIIATILAMCGSFAMILAVVGHMAQPESVAHPRRRVPVTTTAPPAPQLRAPEATRQRPTRSSRRPQSRQTEERNIPDVPTRGNPVPLPDIVPADLVDEVEAALTPAQIQRMAREATTRLEGLESSLSQQVVALKKSRDAMLDQLADELRSQNPSAAGTLLLSLDDELAVLTLKRLTRAQRQAILENIPGKRRTRLQTRLR
ncbi:MAG: hypothetical protein HN712_06335 [Gemmatimonadetes bacterium]|jgi:hypothetical protein|nr:hypothetical protein [Gemmatimonadota bacterium]MBT6145342.1 hypothetical protein [Gemmatimonadota bacterium]MBT7859911.1 hypothetical protein [Gemmatimonadota bacterium]